MTVGEWTYRCFMCSFSVDGVTSVEDLVNLVALHDQQRHGGS